MVQLRQQPIQRCRPVVKRAPGWVTVAGRLAMKLRLHLVQWVKKERPERALKINRWPLVYLRKLFSIHAVF